MKKKDSGRDSGGKFIKGNKLSKMSSKDLDRLVDEYCEHRAKGLDKWSFKGCDHRTIERSATDLHAEKIRVAEAEGWQLWEEAVTNISLGISHTLPNGQKVAPSKTNPTLLIFLMKNKLRSLYGDKPDHFSGGPPGGGTPDKPRSTLFTIVDPDSNRHQTIEIGADHEETA